MDQNSITFSDMDSMVTRQASDDKEKNDKDTFKRFVMESGLSVRAKNVLLSNVQSLEAFEQLTEENLVFLPNCGKKTVREITEFLNTLRLQGGIQAPVSIEEMFLKSPIDSTVEMLPIFSNKRLHQVTSKDLHPDFQGDVKLEDIKLSHRTFYTLLNQGKMEIIGDVMLATSSDLLSLKNIGRKSLNEIKDVIRSLCKTGEYSPKNKEIESVLIDFSSFENLFSSYSRLCLKKERNQLLLQDMFLFESKSATMHRIDELDKTEMINLASRRPLESFLLSGYFTRFSQKGRKLKLIDSISKKTGYVILSPLIKRGGNLDLSEKLHLLLPGCSGIEACSRERQGNSIN